MKVPKIFTNEKGKEVTQEDIEEIIKKTLVDKILVKNIAKELKDYIESEILSKRINLGFSKTINLKENSINTVTRKEMYPFKDRPEQIRNNMEVKYETKCNIMNQEITSILEKIMEAEPSIKEEEVLQKNNWCFSILSKKMIYELSLNYHANEERVDTGRTEPYKKINKRTLRTFFKINFVKEETLELPVIDVYHNVVFYGSVKYVKFNHEHNAKIMKILRDLGYNAQVNIIEDKCKK